MEGIYKIDDVAKQSGLSKRAIRYYEEIGLLKAPPRSKGGTRIYSQDHIEALKKVTTFKEVLGFTLQELQHFLGIRENFEREREKYREIQDPIGQKEKLIDIKHTLDDQIQVIDEKMKKLQKVKMDLAALSERAGVKIEKLDQATPVD